MIAADWSLALFGLAVGIFVMTAVVSLLLYNSSAVARWVGGIGSAMGSGVFAFLGVYVLSTPGAEAISVTGFSLPIIKLFGNGSWSLDHLNAIFFVLLGVIGVAASLYGIGYARLHEREHSTAWMQAMTALFLGSMGVVLASNHAVSFLFAWELMTLTSFALVVYQHEKPEVTRAAFLYLVTTQLATACLIAAFTILAPAAGSFLFTDWSGVGAFLSSGFATFTFAMLFIGFGIKAGVVPFHVWLPEAHPQAPTHISALMSGVMIKIALYAFLRIAMTVFDRDMASWWGLVVLAMGALTAIVGVFYAIERRDMKKALAFSSIENVGIIVMAIGASFYFASTGNDDAAVLGLVAALLHIINHGLLKSLLFLAAGNVYFRHHTRSMDFLGGVAKTLPATSVLFLIGAVGLMGLPPMNAFVSEWLTFQTLLAGLSETAVGPRLLFPIMISALALAAGLAFVVFARMFGIVFLGRPRSEEYAALRGKPTPRIMLLGAWIPALAAITVGIAIRPILNRVTRVVLGSSMNLEPSGEFLRITRETGRMFTGDTLGANPLLALLGILAFSAMIWLLVRLIGGKQKIRSGPSWDCGVPLNERMQYSGLGFTSPIRHALRLFTRPIETVETIQGPKNFYFWHVRSYSVQTWAIFDTALIQPVTKLLSNLGAQIHRAHTGRVTLYVAYVAGTLMLFLILARIV